MGTEAGCGQANDSPLTQHDIKHIETENLKVNTMQETNIPRSAANSNPPGWRRSAETPLRPPPLSELPDFLSS
jgi:hypothetical protein